MAFSVKEGVVFGVLFPVPGGRQEFVAGVYPQVVHEELVRFFQAVPVAVEVIGPVFLVHAVVRGGYLAVAEAVMAGLPIAEGGDLRAGVDLGRCSLREEVLSVSPVVHAHFLLQEVAGGVDEPLSGALQHHGAVLRTNAETVFRKAFEVPEEDVSFSRGGGLAFGE